MTAVLEVSATGHGRSWCTTADAGHRSRPTEHADFGHTPQAVTDQAAPLRGAGSGAPRAGSCLGEARPALPRRPFGQLPQIRQAYSASAVANVARHPLARQLLRPIQSRPKP